MSFWPGTMYRRASSAVAAPTLASLNYSLADTAGGGQNIIATGTNCASVTSILHAGISVSPISTTSTTVTYAAPAKVAGSAYTVNLVGPGGSSSTLPFEHWAPAQITNVDIYLDANKGVTQSATVVSAWADQVGAVAFSQATVGNRPTQPSNVFGTMPSIRFSSASSQYLQAAALRTLATGLSFFFVGKTSTTFSARTGFGAAGTVVGEVGGGCWGGFGIDAGASAGAAYSMFNNGGSVNQPTNRGSGLNDGTARLIGVTSDTTPNVKIYVGATQQGATNSPTGGYDTVNTTYDSIGADGPSGPIDLFNGDLGAVIVVKGVISAGDLTKLNNWSKQRFGTP